LAFVVFAGQSNMGGAYMDASTLSRPWVPDPLTFIWDATVGAWAQMTPGQNTGYGQQSAAWGPEVQFALDFRAKFPAEELRIVKDAQGGTSLAADTAQWHYDWSPTSSNEWFDLTASMVAAAGATLAGARPDLVFWGQGEQDAQTQAMASAYESNLSAFFSAVRQKWLSDPNGKIGFFEIGPTSPYSTLVRQAQESVAHSDPNTKSFDTASYPLQADGLHFAASGYNTAGDSFFQDYVTWRDAAASRLVSGPSADTLVGGMGDDTLVGGAGDDRLDGGSGWNTAVYSGAKADYSISSDANGWVITDLRPGSPDGRDTLLHIQVLQFSDGNAPLGYATPLDATVAAAISSVLRKSPTTSTAAPLANDLSHQIASGGTMDQAISQIVHDASASASVAVLTYEFFTAHTPSAAGMDYLVSPTGANPDNLNAAYYQSFNLENRYINFAVNLGKYGAGASGFSQAYAGLDLMGAARQAYATIFGGTPSDTKLHALLDASVTVDGHAVTRADYFAAYGGDGTGGLGTKAAMVGWLLAEAVKSDVGTYALSNDAFLTDVGLHNAPFAVDLVGAYGKPEFVYQPG
jgi:hypothetical protein